MRVAVDKEPMKILFLKAVLVAEEMVVLIFKAWVV
jgi:hypothetical protein